MIIKVISVIYCVKYFKKILVYRIGHLGDTLVSLPAFWAIRKAYPKAHITLLTNSNPHNPNYILAQNVLPKEGLYDDWLTFNFLNINKYKVRVAK